MVNKVKKTRIYLHIKLIVAIVLAASSINSFSQEVSDSKLKVGAFYFDGWNGKNAYQLNPHLISNFPERKPIWGWVTSTQDLVNEQIKTAEEYGISFFTFCWFYNKNKTGSLDDDQKNTALKFFLKSEYKSKLEYSLLVSNHKGYEINKHDWNVLISYWIKLFKDPRYLNVNNKPLITFFNLEGLIKTFGSINEVKLALNKFRDTAVKSGLNGVTIAVCLSPTISRVRSAENIGFDLLTNYNFHKEGFKSQLNEVKAIENMTQAERHIWTKLSTISNLPQIPTVTLNWDPRPTEVGKKNISSRYIGFSGKSVFNSINNAREWVNVNSNHVTEEKIVTLFAWNEYSEGAWLTPSRKLGNSLLDGVQRALKISLPSPK